MISCDVEVVKDGILYDAFYIGAPLDGDNPANLPSIEGWMEGFDQTWMFVDFHDGPIMMVEMDMQGYKGYSG